MLRGTCLRYGLSYRLRYDRHYGLRYALRYGVRQALDVIIKKRGDASDPPFLQASRPSWASVT